MPEPLTDAELAAIRERAQCKVDAYPWYEAAVRRMAEAEADRAALLCEVERLRLELMAFTKPLSYQAIQRRKHERREADD